MRVSLSIALLTLGVVSAGPVLALNCRRAATAVEAAICRDPKLLQLDRNVDDAYRRARAAAGGAARLVLLNQERSWLQTRDNLCRTADASCLQSSYTVRLAQLRGSDETAQAYGSRPVKAVPAALNGTWRIASVKTTIPNAATDPASLHQALGGADLPPIGSTIQAAKGRLCSADQPCEHMTWSATTLERVDGGSRIAQVLNLPLAHRAYSGSTGSVQSNLILIPDRDRNLLAYFLLCKSGQKDCSVAFEVWQPTAQGASITPP